MIYIIGGNGFVGSAIVRYMEKNNVEYKNIQRQNKEEFFGESCDTLIYANGNPYKYKADEDPYFDFTESVTSIAQYVHKIKYKKFILISSVDVYSDKSSKFFTSESSEIHKHRLINYGYHKLIGEDYVRHFCDDYLIFRLAGIVGKGLKKNPVYDFINKDKKVMISKESQLNFINTDFVAEIIFKVMDVKNETFNLGSNYSIRIRDLKTILGFDSEYTKDAEEYIQNYQINVDKIMSLIKLTSSEDAILRYYEDVKDNHNNPNI